MHFEKKFMFDKFNKHMVNVDTGYELHFNWSPITAYQAHL